MIGGIGIMLGFQTDGGLLGIDDAALSCYFRRPEEISCIYLQAGLIGEHFKLNACKWGEKAGGYLGVVAGGVEAPIVVETFACILDLVVVGLGDALVEGGGHSEIHGGSFNVTNFSSGHVGRVGWSEMVGIDI